MLEATPCAQCGAALGPHDLACASCGALVHAAELKRLAAEAEAFQSAGDTSGALAAWRRALDLLPPRSRQHAAVFDKVQSLAATVAAPPKPEWKGAAGAAGALALGLLSKGKLLLTGLAKASTLWSMLLSFGVYWTAFGWKFALGLILTIYVHEMGHVMELARYGIAATAPMFIPGLGALVRLKQYPASVDEDAAVGIAGPRWGTVASVACWAISLATGWGSFAAIARASAFINLFNLIPFATLDGGRAFRALSSVQRVGIAIAFAAAYYLTSNGLLLLLLVLAVFRVFDRTAPRPGNRRIYLELIALIAVLSALAHRAP
jgi:Zn-dependent protease